MRRILGQHAVYVSCALPCCGLGDGGGLAPEVRLGATTKKNAAGRNLNPPTPSTRALIGPLGGLNTQYVLAVRSDQGGWFGHLRPGDAGLYLVLFEFHMLEVSLRVLVGQICTAPCRSRVALSSPCLSSPRVTHELTHGDMFGVGPQHLSSLVGMCHLIVSILVSG